MRGLEISPGLLPEWQLVLYDHAGSVEECGRDQGIRGAMKDTNFGSSIVFSFDLESV